MFVDFRERFAAGDLETDLCIIGAGAAGITIAHRFHGAGVRVCMIESGGMGFDEALQDLYRAEVVGVRYPAEALRLRYFGGTTNHWTGVCGLLDPLDFEPRPWIGSPGWPLSNETLLPYCERAHEILDLGPFAYDFSRIAPDRRLPEFDPAKLRVRVLRQSPPTRFSEKYGPEIGASENVLCLLHANVVDIETTAGMSRVNSVRVATLAGDEARVRARVFVLACGGLENPRLLLSASGVPEGIGNRHGHVGRYFADHIHYQSTAVVVTRGEWWEALQRLDRGTAAVTPILCLGDEVQRREGLLSHRAGLWKGECAPGVREGATCLSLYGTCEQVCDPENRVTLSDQRDALGMPRIRLNWRLADLERTTMERAAVVLAEELGRLRLGFVRLETILQRPEFEKRIWRASHHMGTTRMSERPEDGVVDPDCRVHGMDNFYIAGSSVFPACGQVNPTLTIVALALRLGDHLAERLA